MCVPIGDDEYEHDCRFSQQWYDTQLISGFCTLLNHDAHMKVPPIPPRTNDHQIMMVYCPYPDGVIKGVLPVTNHTTHFVSVVFNNSHFAVLYYDLYARAVSVFDGLNLKITNWQKHIIRTLKEYGLEFLTDDPKCTYRVENHKIEDMGKMKKMFLEISFRDDEHPWIVTNERQYRQKDGYNCGPIAMLKLLEIYGWIKVGAIDAIEDTPAGYRGVAMNFFNMFKDKYSNSLAVEMSQDMIDGKIVMHDITKHSTVTNLPSNPDDVLVGAQKGTFDDLEVVSGLSGTAPICSVMMDTQAATKEAIIPCVETPESPENNPTTIRAKAMEMKNKRQEENALKAMKMCGAVAVTDGIAVGAVVSLKVDYRTHSHANGLLGVVYAVKEETGGILVCCEHGVITHSGTKGDYWVPYDKYRIVAKKDEVIPLPEKSKR